MRNRSCKAVQEGANRIFTILSLFIVVATSHFFSDVTISTDSHLTVPVAMSIIKEGNVDVDEYIEPLSLNSNIAKKFNGHYYNCFPLGPSLIAVPFVYVIDKVLPALTALPGIKNYLKRRSGSVSGDPDVVKLSAIVEVFIASIVVAMTAVLVYLIAVLFTGKTYALPAAFVFAYCTSAWSTASRGLWQHGPSMLMLTIALYLILLAKKTPRIIQFAGLPLAFSYVIRPTNSISVILLSIFVLIQYRKYFLKYAFWFLTIGAPFIATVQAVRGFRRAAAFSAFLVFLLLSFFIHFRGANCEAVYAWNSALGGVDAHPYRLWVWSDAQFLRGISLR